MTRNMKKMTLVFIILLFSSQVFAIVCPVGFNQVDVGNTIEQVTQQCGKPDEQKTTKEPPFQPQEWNFYVKPDPRQTGSVKMTVAFDANKKVMNITVNAQSLTKTPICGKPIQAGDTTDDVKSACGSPAVINQSQPAPGQSAPAMIETTEFKYNTVPASTLIFVNGKLTSRK